MLHAKLYKWSDEKLGAMIGQFPFTEFPAQTQRERKVNNYFIYFFIFRNCYIKKQLNILI